MTVPQALISVFPQTQLDGGELVVHSSNQSIRALRNGMALSTMRRHLARLVQVGAIDRRNSPSGKRYAFKSWDGHVVLGLDLAPLARQYATICHRALADLATLTTRGLRCKLAPADIRALGA